MIQNPEPSDREMMWIDAKLFRATQRRATIATLTMGALTLVLAALAIGIFLDEPPRVISLGPNDQSAPRMATATVTQDAATLSVDLSARSKADESLTSRAQVTTDGDGARLVLGVDRALVGSTPRAPTTAASVEVTSEFAMIEVAGREHKDEEITLRVLLRVDADGAKMMVCRKRGQCLTLTSAPDGIQLRATHEDASPAFVLSAAEGRSELVLHGGASSARLSADVGSERGVVIALQDKTGARVELDPSSLQFFKKDGDLSGKIDAKTCATAEEVIR